MIFLFKIGFLELSWIDILDICFVGLLLFKLYKLMKGSVAVKIFLGFLSLYLFFLVVKAAGMQLLSDILGQFMGVGVLAAIILFQQEIRKFLLLIGKTTTFNRENFFKNFSWKKDGAQENVNITPVIEASKTLSSTNTGALIVFSKSSPLKFYAETGDILDAGVSKRLLVAIFNKSSPLHDGAAIIYENRIKAARCILPVSENDDLPAQFGLRHRAAIGMSETTDTLVLVISEETGQLSVVRNGQIFHNLSTQEVRKKINEYFTEEEIEEDSSVVKSDIEKSSEMPKEEAPSSKKIEVSKATAG